MAPKPIVKPNVAKRPRDRYFADLIDLRHYKHLNNENSWLLVMVDSFSKFGFARILSNKTSEIVCDAIEEIFLYHGPPLILHTDNGGEFTNSKLADMCKKYGVRQVFGRPRAPWIQGQVESLNQSIKSWLSTTSAGYKNFGHNLSYLQRVV